MARYLIAEKTDEFVCDGKALSEVKAHKKGWEKCVAEICFVLKDEPVEVFSKGASGSIDR